MKKIVAGIIAFGLMTFGTANAKHIKAKNYEDTRKVKIVLQDSGKVIGEGTVAQLRKVIRNAQMYEILKQIEKNNLVMVYTKKEWVRKKDMDILIVWKTESGQIMKTMVKKVDIIYEPPKQKYKDIAAWGFPITSLTTIIFLILCL